MNTKRIMAALATIGTPSRIAELGVIGNMLALDTPTKKRKRQLKAKALGLIRHDRHLNWSDK